MTQVAIQHAPSGSPFDQIMELDTDSTPIWRARRLMDLMGYPRWSDFQRVITRATAAAKNTAMDVEGSFRRSPDTSATGRGARPRDDFKLTREAAYLTALNGDPNKDEVAGAQRYFVTQTRKQEIAEGAPTVRDDLALIEQMVHALRADRQRIAAIEASQHKQAEVQQELTARMDGIEGKHDWFAALAYAKMSGLPTERGFLQKIGTAAGRITRRMGLEPAKTQHALFGYVNTYPIAALDGAVEALGGAS